MIETLLLAPLLGFVGGLIAIGLRAVWLGLHEAVTGRRFKYGVRK